MPSVEISIENLHFVCFFRLKGLETALVVLPSGLKVELKSSIDQLLQSPPEGMAMTKAKQKNSDKMYVNVSHMPVASY